jgi:hypothetical protein
MTKFRCLFLKNHRLAMFENQFCRLNRKLRVTPGRRPTIVGRSTESALFLCWIKVITAENANLRLFSASRRPLTETKDLFINLFQNHLAALRHVTEIVLISKSRPAPFDRVFFLKNIYIEKVARKIKVRTLSGLWKIRPSLRSKVEALSVFP